METTEPICKYEGKIQKVMHRIEELVRKDWMDGACDFNEATSIESLAASVCMSTRNLQMMFKSVAHQPLHKYVERRRLEYAQQLMRYHHLSMAEIADHLGYANQQALSNKFAKVWGVSPSQRSAEVSKDRWEDSSKMEVGEPRRETLPSTAVLFLSFMGNYDDYAAAVFEDESWDRLYDYAAERELLPEEPQYWGIAFDDTDISDPEQCRFYAAVSIRDDNSFRIPQDEVIQKMYLPGGRYLVYIHRGAYELLEKFYEAVLRALPCPLGGGYILERYLNSPVDTSKEDLITEVWMPV